MWNKQLSAVLALTLTLLSSGASAELPERLGRELAKADIKPGTVSIMAVSADGETVLEHNPDQVMRSASVMKLLTSYAALELLGPAWSWPTEVHALGEIRDGTLHGPLVIKAYGDPTLSIERLWLLTQELRSRGLRDIKGDLILDISHFGPPAALKQGLEEPWEIVPTPLLVSLQAERLFFDLQAGKVQVRAVPDLGWTFNIDMPVVDGPCTTDIEDQWWPRMDWTTSPPTAYIKGRFPSGCQTRILNIGISDARYFTSTVFTRLWQAQGGQLLGETRLGTAPEGLLPFARTESAPLTRTLMDMNKFSSNPIARLVYLSIGKSSQLPEETAAQAADRTIRAWLAGKGLNFPELVQDTGSGLSRSEQLSARHWTDLLLSARQSRYAAEFVASLPILGVDGTMRKRLKDEPGMGWGHFKTGTLSDTKSLAGYLTTSRGRQLAIAVQINAPSLGRRADPLLEDIVRLLFEDEPDLKQ